MKTIKKTIHYILPVLIVSALVSCKKFLEVEPKNYVSDEVTIVDKASAETATRGIYSALSAQNYYGTDFQSIGYLSGGDIKFVGTVVSTGNFITHTVRADNGTLSTTWAAIYKTIDRANHVITKVPGVVDPALTPALKNQLLGEAYFLRALAYFDLVRIWGGVQIFTSPTVTLADHAGVPRSTAAQTYAQVLNDLTQAEALIPSTLATSNRYRANLKAVYALRARYHLYRSEWLDAETYATKVISDGNYSLLSPYNKWWANNVIGTAESIFEINYNSSFIASTSSHRNSWQPSQNKGNKSFEPNPTIIGLLSDPNVGGTRTALVAYTTVGSVPYGNLYYRTDGTDPDYILRIAEQYLIRSEARAQQGTDLTGAASDLNAVRTRSGVANTTATTQADLLLAIEAERRVEFPFEHHRWFDLVRTGRAGVVLGVTDPNKWIFPIPITEMQADPALVQNPGY